MDTMGVVYYVPARVVSMIVPLAREQGDISTYGNLRFLIGGLGVDTKPNTWFSMQ
jgi:hypothetical protein